MNHYHLSFNNHVVLILALQKIKHFHTETLWN